MKLKCVSAEPVATTFAPLMTTPSSVSRSTWMKTSRTSSTPFWRSIGGLMIAWLKYRQRSCAVLYQRLALSWYGS
jgi:hypothetical protein